MKLVVIQKKIYEIREQKVMLDFDLAELYGVETKVLNQSVKRNIGRFPKDFMFRLTKKEWLTVRSQIVTSSGDPGNWSQTVTSSKKHRGLIYLPFVFTEHGVTMLSSVLKSNSAVKMNIAIVRAFVALKQFALNYKDLTKQIKEICQTVGSHNEQLNQIYKVIEKMLEEKEEKKSWEERERIGFRQKK